MADLLDRRASSAGGGKPTNPNGLVLEGWAQGFLVGSLIIMSSITVANMRKGVLLHKLILLELILGIWHGFWILLNPPAYGWWLSVSAILLNSSWTLHNVIAWMKIKPFLSRPASLVFIGTVLLVQPYWVVEIYANFAYFHDINDLFLRTRPWEALCRDPWWILTTVVLFVSIKTRYELGLLDILRISPRFGVLLGAMLLSIVFIILDVLSVTGALKSTLPTGINPFWKLSMVFKCLTDAIVLDDFKTALDRLRAFKISRLGSFSIDSSNLPRRNSQTLEAAWDAIKPPPDDSRPPPLPSPEADYIHPQWKETVSRHNSEKRKKHMQMQTQTPTHPSSSAEHVEDIRDPSPRPSRPSPSRTPVPYYPPDQATTSVFPPPPKGLELELDDFDDPSPQERRSREEDYAKALKEVSPTAKLPSS